jgi:hypothetical protein
MKKNKILCLFVHYFDPNGKFQGKSKYQIPLVRKSIVTESLNSVRSTNFVDVLTVGIGSKSLINIDINLENVINDPRFLVYEAFELLNNFTSEYDYLMVIEDDIKIEKDIFLNIFLFDSKFSVDHIFLPNRLESNFGRLICIDTYKIPDFLNEDVIFFNNHRLRVYKNPHSGIYIMSKEKFLYSKKYINFKSRDIIIGGYMASAFANAHKPFKLFRVSDSLEFHTVIHLDNYEYRNENIVIKALRRLNFYK